MIRSGIVLPTFRETPDDAFAAARAAFAAGVDGVFCYDHIWPMGQPDRPALAPFPVLATLAAAEGPPATPGGGPYFGTLVARIGLVPNGVLLGQFTALERLAPGRVIAGLGTGDHLSEAENRAYGIPFTPAVERRADMVQLGRALRSRGVTVWVAGGAAARVVEARAAGAALNLWDADPALVADRAQGPDAVEVTWGGPPPKDPAPKDPSPKDPSLRQESSLQEVVRALAEAGATWAIFGWPVDPFLLAAAAESASSVVGPAHASSKESESGS